MIDERKRQKREQRMAEYFAQMETLSDEIPKDATTKLKLMASVLGLIGEFQAEAKGELGQVSTQRKYWFARHKKEMPGTVVDKEAHAREMTLELRTEEARLEAELLRWELAYTSQQEKINTFKLHLKALMMEYGGRIDV